jgi:hypothetical protein
MINDKIWELKNQFQEGAISDRIIQKLDGKEKDSGLEILSKLEKVDQNIIKSILLLNLAKEEYIPLPASIQGPLENLKDKLKKEIFGVANRTVDKYKEYIRSGLTNQMTQVDFS